MRAVSDPYSGLPSKVEWLPKPKEVKDACEEMVGVERRALEWEQRAQKQLTERAEIEAGPRKIPQWMMDQLAECGLTNDHKQRHGETPDKVMARLGLTQAQWDALPNGKG